MSYEAHYQKHLDEVSRSFSFCIARLKSPLKEWVGLGYLLFRVLDTIEDASWETQDLKNQIFKNFKNALDLEETEIQLIRWNLQFPESIPEGEKNLVKNLPELLRDFNSLPEPAKKSLKKSLIMMSQGMDFFSNRETDINRVELKNLTEVNQYCFFVAGIVGEFLTNIIAPSLPQSTLNTELFFNSFQFGLFLQKINLLKDQQTDEKEGRFLVPDRSELLESLAINSEGALNYILTIPATEREYRLFCAWSLFLGLSSLPWIENSFSLKILSKIPRTLTNSLLEKVESVIDDNQALARLFKEKMPIEISLAETTRSLKRGFDSNWLTDIYKGPLEINELQELGVL